MLQCDSAKCTVVFLFVAFVLLDERGSALRCYKCASPKNAYGHDEGRCKGHVDDSTPQAVCTERAERSSCASSIAKVPATNVNHHGYHRYIKRYCSSNCPEPKEVGGVSVFVESAKLGNSVVAASCCHDDLCNSYVNQSLESIWPPPLITSGHVCYSCFDCGETRDTWTLVECGDGGYCVEIIDQSQSSHTGREFQIHRGCLRGHCPKSGLAHHSGSLKMMDIVGSVACCQDDRCNIGLFIRQNTTTPRTTPSAADVGGAVCGQEGQKQSNWAGQLFLAPPLANYILPFTIIFRAFTSFR